MSDSFEYDVFLSFASSDVEIVKPIWRELCSSGLRVFWSNSELKKEIGNSWFDVIQSSLENSRHLLLVWSQSSKTSEWVRREYSAFYNYCHKPRIRRLIPLLVRGCNVSDLPLLIRDIEVLHLERLESTKELIPILGGVDIEELRLQNEFLKQNVESLSQENSSLQAEVKRLTELSLSTAPEATNSSDYKGDSGLELREAYEILGLSFGVTSEEIAQRYEALKAEYEALIVNSSKGLRGTCESRLQLVENAFKLVFEERKTKEDQELTLALETLQISKGASPREIRRRFYEIRRGCLKGIESSDRFIREAAADELIILKAAVRTLIPTSEHLPEEFIGKAFGLTEVVIPHMGDVITEAQIIKWLKKEGERIDKGESLFEISTDKVDAEIPSPSAGILTSILASEGETLPVNSVVALIKPDTGVFSDTK